MDPKSLANLDPKLRETYERVMGTTTPSSDGSTDPSPFAPAKPVAADAAPAGADTTQSPMAASPEPTAPPAETVPPAEPIPTMSAFSTPGPAPEAPQAAETPTVAAPSAYMSVGEAPAQTENPYASAAPFPSPADVAQSHEVSPVLRVLYIVGAVIFFIAYTFFWLKIFNLSLPF